MKKYLILLFCFMESSRILFICMTSGNDTEKLNKCLKTNTLDYCNKEVM